MYIEETREWSRVKSHTKNTSLCWERLSNMHSWCMHRPALLVILQEAVQLFQVGDDVVFNVGGGDLKPHAAAVEGACEVPGKHFINHPRDNWNDLNHNQLSLSRFPIRPFFSKTEVDLIRWLFFYLSLLMGNQLT